MSKHLKWFVVAAVLAFGGLFKFLFSLARCIRPDGGSGLAVADAQAVNATAHDLEESEDAREERINREIVASIMGVKAERDRQKLDPEVRMSRESQDRFLVGVEPHAIRTEELIAGSECQDDYPPSF